LKNDKSENKVYAESSLKNLLLSVHEAHYKQVRHLKEEGEASLKVVADEHAVNWQTALDKQQQKDKEIQQLQRLLQEKETCMQKLTQEQSRSKEEYRTLQSSWQKLSNKKAALEKKMKTAFEEGKVTEEEKNSGERAEEESKKIKV
jgi:peptidoglycan hydrolase CwlO-like protein